MRVSWSRVALWLLVVVAGIEIGAGIYEARVLVPLWASAAPDSLVVYNLQALRPTPGPRFWMVSTPLVGLLALVNLIAAWRSRSSWRGAWAAGAAAMVAMVVLTFVYFVPTLLKFEALRSAGGGVSAESVHRWATLNWVRAAVYLTAWFAVLRAYGAGAGREAERP